MLTSEKLMDPDPGTKRTENRNQKQKTKSVVECMRQNGRRRSIFGFWVVSASGWVVGGM